VVRKVGEEGGGPGREKIPTGGEGSACGESGGPSTTFRKNASLLSLDGIMVQNSIEKTRRSTQDEKKNYDREGGRGSTRSEWGELSAYRNDSGENEKTRWRRGWRTSI